MPEPEDDRIAWARQLYGGLVDPGLSAYDDIVDVDPEADRTPDVARRLDTLFLEHPEYRGVALRITGSDARPQGAAALPHPPLVASHARVRSSLGVAGVGADDWGAGDRAGLPGTSTQYRIVLFVCLVCGQGVARAYYDARLLPECTAGHGALELVR